jgi:hypothetical protein
MSDPTAWAWALAALTVVNLGTIGLTAVVLAWAHVRRHRPLVQLADALATGDLDQARFHLDALRGAAGAELSAICRPTLSSGPPELARDRFVRAYLVAYPSVPLLPKLLAFVCCGTTAALPLLVGAAGWAAAVTGSIEMGVPVPDQATVLLQLGLAETLAAGAVTLTLIAVSHRVDPGSRRTRRKLIPRLLHRPS